MRRAPGARPLVIGHRGAMADAPENTYASFREALDQGADGVECDVHLSADGVVVVHHDFTLERTTDGAGRLADHPWAELARLEAGAWFAERFRGERLPRLDELLSWLAAEATRRARPLWAVIELKAGSRRYPGIEAATVRAIEASGLRATCSVISFDHAAVREVKRLAPDLATGILYHAAPIDPVAMARAAGADLLGPNREWVGREEVEAAHAGGQALFVWTVDTPEQALALSELGVDAFGANSPRRARERLS